MWGIVRPLALAEEQHGVGRRMREHALRRLTNPALCAQGVVRRLILLRVEIAVGLLDVDVEGKAGLADLENGEKVRLLAGAAPAAALLGVVGTLTALGRLGPLRLHRLVEEDSLARPWRKTRPTQDPGPEGRLSYQGLCERFGIGPLDAAVTHELADFLMSVRSGDRGWLAFANASIKS